MNAEPVSVPRPRSRWGRSGPLAVFAALAAATALVLIPLAPAHALLPNGRPANNALIGPNTEIVISSIGEGLTTTFYLAPTPIVPDAEVPYPDAPPAGYVAESGFLGVINTESVDDFTLTAQMYCINVRVSTTVGTGYESGTWEESTVPNIDYVTYILTNYYPAVDAPAGLTPAEQAAAVQAAIWYFTDGVVLGPEPPAAVRAATAAIIAAAQTAELPPEPSPPDVDITPASAAAPAGTAAGPYVVTAEDAATLTVSVPAGYTMYTDAASTTPLANPSEVPSGTSIWVTGPGVTGDETVLNARAAVTVQRGNVYLYDGNTPSVQDAQRLILAVTTELEAVASATTEFFTAGDLTVNKSFAGAAVGEQGAIQLAIDCGEGFTFTTDIPAGTSTTQTFTYPGIPAGNTCTVTEPTTGTTTEVIVTSDAPQEVVMADEGAAVTVNNTVEFAPGTLNLVKVIAGGGASFQDDTTVSITCVSGLEETFTIPAGSEAGEYTESFAELPAGDLCTIAELDSGANTVVEVTTDAPVTVTISPGAVVEGRVTNTVEFLPGSLNLTKVITGAGAGSQDESVLSITCTSGLAETFTIPAESEAGEYTQTYEGIPAGDECTVTELASGANAAVDVTADAPVTVIIPPGAAVAAEVTNTVEFLPGSLNVIKVVAGGGAGSQDDISLSITCVSGFEDTVVIPAGSEAGEYPASFQDLPAGDVCTVTELESGANSVVDVTTDDPVTVTINPNTGVIAELTNTVTFRPGSLSVVKAIIGPGAGLQSGISIGVVCDNGLVETFEIPARSAAGQYVQTFSDLPAGTECTVTELASGANNAVNVVADTSVTVTIEPGAEVAALLTNSVLVLQPGPTAGELDLAGKSVGGKLAHTGAGVTPMLGAGAGLLGTGLFVLAALRGTRRKTDSNE